MTTYNIGVRLNFKLKYTFTHVKYQICKNVFGYNADGNILNVIDKCRIYNRFLDSINYEEEV